MTYSAKLWDLFFTPGSGSAESDVVPVGFIWVVRDVEACNQGTTADLAILATSLGNWNLPLPSTSPGDFGENLQWKGRVVVVAGDSLKFNSEANSWALYVSGYVLNVP